MRIAVTGSNGLIGTALVEALEGDGHQVTTARPGRRPTAPTRSRWDPAAGTIDAAGLEGHDAVVHLAGVGIGDHRWTAEHKAAVLDSRVQGTSLLATTLAGLDRPPAVLASASAVGYYGDRGDQALTEADGPGTGFLADVVQQWEDGHRARGRRRHPGGPLPQRRGAHRQGRRPRQAAAPVQDGPRADGSAPASST